MARGVGIAALQPVLGLDADRAAVLHERPRAAIALLGVPLHRVGVQRQPLQHPPQHRRARRGQLHAQRTGKVLQHGVGAEHRVVGGQHPALAALQQAGGLVGGDVAGLGARALSRRRPQQRRSVRQLPRRQIAPPGRLGGRGGGRSRGGSGSRGLGDGRRLGLGWTGRRASGRGRGQTGHRRHAQDRNQTPHRRPHLNLPR